MLNTSKKTVKKVRLESRDARFKFYLLTDRGGGPWMCTQTNNSSDRPATGVLCPSCC